MTNYFEDFSKSFDVLLSSGKLLANFLRQEYPSLMLDDLKILLSNLSDLFDEAFSSCLLYKTSRIELLGKFSADYGGDKKMILTQDPGLKFPRHHYSGLDFKNLINISSNYRFTFGDSHSSEESYFDAKILLTHSHILQDRFALFLTFTKRFVGWNRRYRFSIFHYDTRAYHQPTYWLQKKSVGLQIGTEPADITFLIKSREFSLATYLQQSLEFEEKDCSISDSDNLKQELFLLNLPVFLEGLKVKNAEKHDFVKELKNLTENVSKFVLPYRTLKQLKS